MLKKVIIATVTIIAIFAISMGCIDSEGHQDVETTIVETTIPITEIELTEMENLQLFLEKDQTDEMNYDPNEQKGLNFLSGAKFVRALALNASEYNIPMGAMIARDTQAVGRFTNHDEPMNYAIINSEFIVIDPRSDQIYRLNELGNCNRYVSVMPDAQMMESFGRRSRGIDIDLERKYDEKQLIENFKPTTS